MTLVLASGSAARRLLLQQAGLAFDVAPAGIDERAIDDAVIRSGGSPQDVAETLAAAKAVHVSNTRPADLVIGADQTLEIDGERLTKPRSLEHGIRQLARLSGRTHALHSAVAVAQAGSIIWRFVDTARLTMRQLDEPYLRRYAEAAGPEVLGSVGVYQLEGRGVQLFERIDGDYFTILGLPLLPLLAFLRSEGMLE